MNLKDCMPLLLLVGLGVSTAQRRFSNLFQEKKRDEQQEPAASLQEASMTIRDSHGLHLSARKAESRRRQDGRGQPTRTRTQLQGSSKLKVREGIQPAMNEKKASRLAWPALEYTQSGRVGKVACVMVPDNRP
jgi:hypothetical protein